MTERLYVVPKGHFTHCALCGCAYSLRPGDPPHECAPKGGKRSRWASEVTSLVALVVLWLFVAIPWLTGATRLAQLAAEAAGGWL